VTKYDITFAIKLGILHAPSLVKRGFEGWVSFIIDCYGYGYVSAGEDICRSVSAKNPNSPV